MLNIMERDSRNVMKILGYQHDVIKKRNWLHSSPLWDDTCPFHMPTLRPASRVFDYERQKTSEYDWVHVSIRKV